MPTESVELGYLAHPGGDPRPGVVMIHDVWGLSDHTRELARRLAGEGCSVLAVDLYRREPDLEIEDPGAFMRALPDPQVVDDLRAAVEFLSRHPSVAGRSVGITGFCMGGMYAILAACSGLDLRAAVAFYGLLSHEHGILHGESGPDRRLKPRQPLDALADLGCPLLCIYGDADEFVPQADIETLEARLADAPHSGEVVVFPGCGHAFLNDTRPDAYRPAEAEAAWQRMVEFFRKRLD